MMVMSLHMCQMHSESQFVMQSKEEAPSRDERKEDYGTEKGEVRKKTKTSEAMTAECAGA